MEELLEGVGLQVTDMNCTECGKYFRAELDHDTNGDHVIECPHCMHEHLRTIKDGKITESRWGSRNQRDTKELTRARTWKSSVIQARTSSASVFIRDKWLNFGR